MNTNAKLDVARAERELAEAQAQLEQARKVVAIEESFGEPVLAYAVMAKTPEYHQFVSYPHAGKLVAVFAIEEAARRYAETMPSPFGADFVVEEVNSYN